jgi:hypothetical protein
LVKIKIHLIITFFYLNNLKKIIYPNFIINYIYIVIIINQYDFNYIQKSFK